MSDGRRLVLDAEALNAIADPRHQHRDQVRRAIAATHRLHRDLVAGAVTLAEVYRGRSREQQVDAAVARTGLKVVPTDRGLARTVGRLLHQVGAGSEDLVDAHAVALAMYGGGVVLTGDPDDLERLAAGLPHVTIVPLG